MSDITYQGKIYNCRQGESILEAFLRQGVNLPFSCRAGVCQVCLQRAVKGPLPEGAQKGLKESLIAKKYFLPCVCRPEQNLEFAPPSDEDLYFTAMVSGKDRLAEDIYRIHLEPSLVLNYHAGQFINLRRPDGLIRSYSLVSVPEEDYYLELHVKRMRNGVMSNWLIDELEVGGEIDMLGPNGNCFYATDDPEQNMLLVGAGTGLGPLSGIVRTALNCGHNGQIYLYHGSSTADGLYLVDELRELEKNASNFHYVSCASRGASAEHVIPSRAHDRAFRAHDNLAGWRVHLAGNPGMVEDAQARALRKGASPNDIFADSFALKDLCARPIAAGRVDSITLNSGRREFSPDPEMWMALKEGGVMNAILTDFYTRAFDDPVLSPYFHGVTKQRLIEKVYSFMRQIFTGEKRYFGDRPRNAHHWMVISNEVFDHREKLMRTCMREHGLAEHLIMRWLAIEECFREDIVKAEPFGRVVDGVELPVDGFGETRLEVGALCDSCGRVLDAGEHVRYHLRLGHIYCHECIGRPPAG